jgi:Dolichyl-phosphate-mannose-protein mannosyltransferase
MPADDRRALGGSTNEPRPRPERNQHGSGRWLLLSVLLLALLVRTYHLGYPFWEPYATREAFNLMVVRAFIHHGIHLFYPAIDWLVHPDPSVPSYFCAEFPVVHALAVLPFGDWCTRLIPIAFSLAGLWWIYSLTRRVIGQTMARFAALAWAVLPFSIFFGQAFMSDGPALGLATGALDAFTAWLETRRPLRLLVFVLLGSLAGLAKPQVAPFGLVVAYLAFLEFRWRFLAQWKLYFAAVVIALPASLWIHHSRELLRAGGPFVIGPGIVGHSLHLWMQASAWGEQWDRLFSSALGPVALGLTAAGFVWPVRNPRQYLFHVWFLASALFLFLIPEAIIGWNDYYSLLLVPPSVGLIGIALGNLYEYRATRQTAVLLTLALAVSFPFVARPFYRSDKLHYHLGKLLNRLTRPNDLIATSAGASAEPLYFSERRGWEFWTLDLSGVEKLSSAGAKVFAIADHEAIRRNSTVVPLLDRRFLRLFQDDEWIIWSLDPADLPQSPRPESGAVAPVVNFGNKIALLAVSVREVLRWPPSFEVKYNWRCLDKIDASLCVWVHGTTPEGQEVLNLDHWPAAGRFPTPSWNVRDVIRERYVVVLRGEVRPGRYQLHAGWYDPVGGARLPIVSGASDGKSGAVVADIYVLPQPRAGWFGSGEY